MMELVNVLSQEVLRSESYSKTDIIKSIIKSGEDQLNNKVKSYIIDANRKTLEAEYVTHSVIQDGENTVYRLFYKVKLSPVQAVIR